MDEPEEGMQELVQRALRLVETGRVFSESELTSERFVQFARTAAAERNRGLTLQYLELAFLRGDRELLDPCRVLDFAEDGQLEEARSLAGTLSSNWYDALSPMLRD